MLLRRLVCCVLAAHVLPRNGRMMRHANDQLDAVVPPFQMMITRADASEVLATRFASEEAPLYPEYDENYDVELDLDLPSKRKLHRQRGSRHLDSDPIEIGITPTLDGETPPRRPGMTQDWSQKVKPATFNYGRGVGYVTTQAVESGDVLFSIPFTEIMTTETAHQGRIKVLLDANPTLPSSIALALHLLEEKFRGEASRFEHYIESLPSIAGLNGTIFYSDKDFEGFEASHLYRVTQGRRQAIKNFYEALLGPVTSTAVDPPLFTSDQFTLDNFRWAMGIVWSRAFPLSKSDEDAVIAPVLDTIGACVEADCPETRLEWDTRSQRLVVFATEDYAADDEVRLDFSYKSSALMMLNHGFSRPAPWSQVETFDMSIFLDPNDTLISIKSHLLQTQNLTMNGTYILRYNSNSLDAEMMKSLKTKLLSAAELDKHRELFEPTSDRPILSLRNEFVFTRAVLLSCRNLLKQYPTRLEDDRQQLTALENQFGGRVPTDRRIHMLRSLVIEKEILQHTEQLVLKQWQDLLTLDNPNVLGV
ncbi:hypothetical protein Poli38472_008191 [Pythium oligandrum]|uniref:Rubisco LSMT substrate-binding domain-containing protein n=1 Tax=Pythium oligandrum TaxID=41045 RepID=A0A8K1FLS4_PYTOL|nr:hypothetical protein Poli38472_008191 [Pythium oligandrum]|eukprot:TMW65549.1 hypothetical protein Poli38472_008191 [Pythium oligandrum]